MAIFNFVYLQMYMVKFFIVSVGMIISSGQPILTNNGNNHS